MKIRKLIEVEVEDVYEETSIENLERDLKSWIKLQQRHVEMQLLINSSKLTFFDYK